MSVQKGKWVLSTADCYRIGRDIRNGKNGYAKSISIFRKIIIHTIPDLVLRKVEPFIHNYALMNESKFKFFPYHNYIDDYVVLCTRV